MKITKRQIRKIIKESLLVETEMLKIMHNPYEDLSIMNRIANYALMDDIDGAMADPEVNYENLDLDLDEMKGYVQHVGDTSSRWFTDDVVVPDNWDVEEVYEFMDDLEAEWYRQRNDADVLAHKAAPNVDEREAIGGVLTQGYVLPEDIPEITYQVHRKGGKPHVIHMENENIETGDGLDARWAQQHNTTLDKIIDVLDQGGAKLRKKRKPVRHTPPMYD